MQYNSDNKEIQVSKAIISGYDNNTIASTLLHEITHHITVGILGKPKNKMTFAEKQIFEVIEKYFNKYKKYKHNHGEKSNFTYGFESIEEFVAEFYSNPSFREYAKQLSDSWYFKLIKEISDAFRRLFGLPLNKEYDTLFSNIFDLIESGDLYNIENNLYVREEPFAKRVSDAEEVDLTTIDKRLNNVIGKAKDRVEQLYNRTKKAKSKNSGTFLKLFKELKDELEKLGDTKKWQAIVSYSLSFKSAVNSLNERLNEMYVNKTIKHENVTYNRIDKYEAYKTKDNKILIPEDVYEQYKNLDFIKQAEESNNLIKDSELFNTIENLSIKQLNNKEHLDLANEFENYLNAYDLLDEINKLIEVSEKDTTLTRQDKLDIKQIKSILYGLSKSQEGVKVKISKIRKESAINLFADPSNNKEIVKVWNEKLRLEYLKLKNPVLSKDEWISQQLQTTYKEEFEKDLIKAAEKIVNNPYTDISGFTKTWVDLLNTNSPLINIMSNVIGKMRDVIVEKINNISFEFDKVFQEYSKFNDNIRMSKKYGNLLELSVSNDRYYLKGKYSVKFIDDYNEMLSKITEPQKKKSKIYKDWIKNNTEITYNELDMPVINPAKKYLNKPLSKEEQKLINFFIAKTKKNNKDSYKGRSGLVKTFFGEEFYILPSVTKSNKERKLEGDLFGQVKDAYTDLTETKVDDVNYGEAFDTKGNDLRRVKINYRGKLKSKDQSLDLMNIYRLEETNAIVYAERNKNENVLKLFLQIAGEKEYKKQSLKTGQWAQNIFAKNIKGQTFQGKDSNEYSKIKGLLETHLYDVLSYNETKILGKFDANKVTQGLNSVAASVAMSFNIGSATVNAFNGYLMMQLERIGNYYIKGADLEKSSANYSANLPKILADINNPVKKSFHNQMLNMFDAIGGSNIIKQEFLNNSAVKELLSSHNLNFMNDGVEHMLNSILTESVLRGIPVMNSDSKYINKEGKEVNEKDAASLFDMLYLDENGILKMNEKVAFTKYNLIDNYHKTGKQSITYLVKKQITNLYGVYDNNMKAEIHKHWYGKLILMFKNFFMSQAQYRYTGFSSAYKDKKDLTTDDLNFNNAEQEYIEGIYTTFVRTFIPLLKGLNLTLVKENLKNLSDYEKANLKKVFFEISATAIILPIIGALLVANADSDDDEIFFFLYAFRRLESELSQFRNPMELQRMISNPIAANRFVQNAGNLLEQIITPINFNPTNNENYFDWLSENNKGENKMFKSVKKVSPVLNQLDKNYHQMWGLIEK
jgi:hypothetical protein